MSEPRFLIKPRWLAETLAKAGGYFWHPCPRCGQDFAGFEASSYGAVPTDRPGIEQMVCADCGAQFAPCIPETRIQELASRVHVLEAALRPFAIASTRPVLYLHEAWGGPPSEDWPDDAVVELLTKAGDVRRARSVLGGETARLSQGEPGK